MTVPPTQSIASAGHAPVTMLELFFDLVFVFLVIQLTSLITSSSGWAGYGRAALVLLVTGWMYLGYAWLANIRSPTSSPMRLAFLVAMTCFLLMAVVVPDAFGEGAWMFALSYLLVVAIHQVVAGWLPVERTGRAMRAVAPSNFASAAMLILAAIVGERWGWVCWILAVCLLLVPLSMRHVRGFALRIEHIAERHRLLIIVALGETIVAVGASAEGHITETKVFTIVVLSMILICGLWWTYFATGDDPRGVAALERLPRDLRTARASLAFSYIHMLHIAGLVLVAVGLHDVVHDPTHHLAWGVATSLSAGIALFLVGQALFRLVLGIGPTGIHLCAALIAMAGVPLGAEASGGVQLAFVTLVVAVCAAALQIASPPVLAVPGESSG
jgi:low temperature requirement protein LtrA